MLIAAMVLGLIGGIAYFVGSGAELILRHEYDVSLPWWLISLPPIGVIGAVGGAMARWRPSYGGSLLLLAGAAAIVVGFLSYEEIVEEGRYLTETLPIHPFEGLVFYLPLPLLSLIIAGALALAGREAAETQS